MADEVEALTQDRQALLDSTELTAKIVMGLGAEVKGLERYPDAIAKLRVGQYTDQRICDDIERIVLEAADAKGTSE